jgi:hypothetical protein
MPIRSNKLLMFIPVFILLSGCAVTHAPKGWLSDSPALQFEAFGGWMQVHYSKNDSLKQTAMGELIALSSDSLYVLSRTDTLNVIAVADVTHARLVEYKSHHGELGGWIALGTLSTVSHGWYLILTAPLLWVFAGTLAASSRSYDPILDYPRYSFNEFRPYARFPQGLPKNLDRHKLKPKPLDIETGTDTTRSFGYTKFKN